MWDLGMVDGYHKRYGLQLLRSRDAVDQKKWRVSRITIRVDTRNNAAALSRYWAWTNKKEKKSDECTRTKTVG
jgi:hypothetical protein